MDSDSNILFLPLDRMNMQTTSTSVLPSDEAISGIADSVVRELNAREAASRARESR